VTTLTRTLGSKKRKTKNKKNHSEECDKKNHDDDNRDSKNRKLQLKPTVEEEVEMAVNSDFCLFWRRLLFNLTR
jgi:hypothetical protein